MTVLFLKAAWVEVGYYGFTVPKFKAKQLWHGLFGHPGAWFMLTVLPERKQRLCSCGKWAEEAIRKP